MDGRPNEGIKLPFFNSSRDCGRGHAQCILTNTSDQLVLIARSIHTRIQERRACNFIIENDCSKVYTSFAYNINFFSQNQFQRTY